MEQDNRAATIAFEDAIRGLHRGDFDALAPLFFRHPSRPGEPPAIVEWQRAGRLEQDGDAQAEALSCACFLGAVETAEHLLECGTDPVGGMRTGLNALHWAVNRGQHETVRLLLRWRAPLEIHNMYGGTALGTAIWSAIHEPRPSHLEIIDTLLRAGARTDDVEYPTGHAGIDALLRRSP